mgnify:CR=1 FL=1|nr:MAG TPA: hypothetical protein [Caudoviricetes sp.]
MELIIYNPKDDGFVKGGNMGKFIDLTGQRFGRLEVLALADDYVSPKGCIKKCWLCICDCGNKTIVTSSDLKSGHTKSCGCLPKQIIGEVSRKHGKRHTKIYHRWLDMKQRCYNPNNSHYKSYGGRGITVCDEWKDNFQAFYDWAINNGYSDSLSIERIDVNGNYIPSNCKWIPMTNQARNKVNTIYFEYDGEIKTLAEWAEIKDVKYNTLLRRVRTGTKPEFMFYKGRLKKWN